MRGYSPGGGCMGFPSIKSSYAYIWWLGLLRVVQALKVIILPLPLSAGVVCCPPLIFKPSLGRREKLPQRVGRREIYRPVPPPSLSRVAKGFSVTPDGSLIIGEMRDRAQISPWGEIAWLGICLFSWVVVFVRTKTGWTGCQKNKVINKQTNKGKKSFFQVAVA